MTNTNYIKNIEVSKLLMNGEIDTAENLLKMFKFKDLRLIKYKISESLKCDKLSIIQINVLNLKLCMVNKLLISFKYCV